ncbi:MAG: T9SS type A sorting domain-containing protein [Opitutaceae bacterium]|nr:T9SS type A sorting domain-containing protein [Cytophagales bacterium]
MKIKLIIQLLLFLLTFTNMFAQQQSFSDTAYNEINRDKVVISPNPIIGGEYFKIKFPDGELYKNLELIDAKGNNMTSSPILFSKMGMYMPKVKKGEYYLKIELDDYTIVQKVWIL